MKEEAITVTENGSQALARLGVFVGEWVLEARFPGDQPVPSNAREDGPQARSRFEWALDGQFLLQRTEVPVPEAPDSLTIVSADLETGAYIQHYYDSRGVVRLYAMTFADGVWTLMRESPDFSPLDFGQRFTGTFSQDGNIISDAWDKRLNGTGWEHDFGRSHLDRTVGYIKTHLPASRRTAAKPGRRTPPSPSRRNCSGSTRRRPGLSSSPSPCRWYSPRSSSPWGRPWSRPSSPWPCWRSRSSTSAR